VQEFPGANRAYAHALLATLDFMSEPRAPLPIVASGLGQVDGLKRRLTMIVRAATPKKLSPGGRLLVLCLAAMLLPLGFTIGKQDAGAADGDKTAAADPAPAAAQPAADNDPFSFEPRPTLLQRNPGEIWAVALSPDGKTLAVVNGLWDKPGALTLWDLPTGKVRATVRENLGIRCVAFAPDGKTLATADFFDKTAKIRDAATGQVLRVLRGHVDGVNYVAFSPDGKLLATAGLDKNTKIWDVATGKETATLTGHTNGVYSLAFSPDGTMLITGGGDNTVRLWDVATGKELHCYDGHANPVMYVVFFPDGRRAASASRDNTLRLWAVPK
jgi:uncharacterized protein with WD repeat